MNRLPLDPWLDAAHIASQLQEDDAELLIALGAEAWCEKCRNLRAPFEALCAAQAPENCTWMWLDLEEHEEFLGDFVPEDLPLLLRYQRGVLVQAVVLEGVDAHSETEVRERLREVPTPDDVPDLWRVFTSKDWARP
jgi:hypothetical protein